MPAKNSPKVLSGGMLMLDTLIFALSTASTQQGFDAVCNPNWRIERVFPNSENSPARFFKITACFFIPCFISDNFILPVAPVVLRQPTVPFAPVPKTSINKNNKPFATKNKIWFARKFQIPAPAGDSIHSKDRNQYEFGSFVSP